MDTFVSGGESFHKVKKLDSVVRRQDRFQVKRLGCRVDKVSCAWIVMLALPSIVNVLALEDDKEMRYGLKAKFIWMEYKGK